MHGKKWRLLAHQVDTTVEVENEGTFDELVVDDWLHVEQMDETVWWLRVGDARLLVTLDREGPPSVDVERGFYAAPKGSTQTGG
jgi:hypothetical protein